MSFFIKERVMKNIYTIILMLLIAGCGGSSEEAAPETEAAVSQSIKAPDFTLPDLNGTSFSLADYSGKPVLVVFWATWCPHCKDEIPVLRDVHEKYKGTDFTILSVSVDNKPDKLKEFAKENGIEYSVLFDEGTVIAKSYGVVGIPANYVIDPDGNGYYYGQNIEDAMKKVDSYLNN
jgi:peroxiredoxin